MTNKPSAYKKLTQVQRLLGFWPAVFKGQPKNLPTVLGSARVRSGNKVSEFGNTSKRTFKPNVVISQFYSELLGEKVKMRVTTRVQKTIHKQGGLDNFMLLSQEKDHICESALALRQRIEAAFLQKGVANLAVKDPKANAGLEGAHCVEGASPKTPSAVAEADDLADLVPTISIPLRSLEVRAAP